MRTQVSVKTITEVEDSSGLFLINCFSDRNDNGSSTPSLYKTNVLDKSMTIDNIKGLEGELIVSQTYDSDVSVNEAGEMLININNDDVNKYEKDNENLKYEG